MRLHEVVPVRSLGDVLRIESLGYCWIWHVSGVAKVVRHHDRRVERSEIKGRYGLLVEALLRVNDNGTFELLSGVLNSSNRDYQVHVLGLSVKLTSNLNLLASGEQEADGNTSDTSHLGQVEEAHQLVEESQRQMSILNTVDGESSTAELILLLQLSNDAVRHVLLLLFEKVETDAVQGVAPQLVVSNDHLHHVDLDSAFHIHLLVLTSSESLDLRRLVLDPGHGVAESTQVSPVSDL